HRPRVHRSRLRASLARLRRAEELRDRPGERRVDPVRGCRRGNLFRAPGRDPRRHLESRRRRRLPGAAQEHLLGTMDPSRPPLPRLAAPALPPWPRPLRGPPRSRIRRGGRAGGAAGGAPRAPQLSRRRRLPGADQPLRRARRRRVGPAEAGGAGARSGAGAARALPLDVHPAPRLPRRVARLSARRPLRVLCVRSLGEGLGEEGEDLMATGRDRVLSGMRPTGKLHLGNYLGALENWVKLQDDGDCFFFVANWHALPTDADNVRDVPANTVEMVADWLGAGLDPQRCTMFVQSLVPEHAELHLLFSMIT